MKSPEHRPAYQWPDAILEILGLLLVATMIILPLSYYGDMPDTIPTHFNAAGEPDGFGPKSTIWWSIALGAVAFLVLAWLSRQPHRLNYPKKLTPENTPRQYLLASRMLRVMNLQIALIFFYVAYSMLATSLNWAESLGAIFIPAVLVSVFATLIVYLVLALRKK